MYIYIYIFYFLSSAFVAKRNSSYQERCPVTSTDLNDTERGFSYYELAFVHITIQISFPMRLALNGLSIKLDTCVRDV